MSSLCGILNVDKPLGKTSRRAVDRVKKLVKPAKVGHAGTLDPLATGVLIICVGPATRLIPMLQDQSKSYRAQFLLGRRSETDDLEGEVIQTAGAPVVSQADVEALLPRFVGEIEQVPPKFSAVHVDGKRAYQLARAGREIEIAPRTVEVHKITLLRFEYPELELEIDCGSGTYIRSIGRDLGELLGGGAVMSSLIRTRVGPCRLDSSVALDDISAETLADQLQPAILAVSHLPRHVCSDSEMELVCHGRPVASSISIDQFGEHGSAQVALLTPDGQLAAIARFDPDDGLLYPKAVLMPHN